MLNFYLCILSRKLYYPALSTTGRSVNQKDVDSGAELGINEREGCECERVWDVLWVMVGMSVMLVWLYPTPSSTICCSLLMHVQDVLQRHVTITHTHTHTLLFDSPPAHCWKVVECFPNERIILKHAGDIEHNNMCSLLQDYLPPPPHQNRAFDPHPIKAFMGLSHVLLSVFTGFDYQRQRIGITEDLLSSIQKPNQGFTVFSLQFVVWTWVRLVDVKEVF